MNARARSPRTFAVAIAAALLLPLTPVAESADAASPGQNGHIAYIRNDEPLNSNGSQPCAGDHIWIMNAGGGGQTNINPTAQGWAMGDPAWSPDGVRLAYSFVSPVNRDTLFVSIYNFKTSTHERSVGIPLLKAPGYDADFFCIFPYGPTWSADGTKVAIQSYYGIAVIDVANNYALTHLDPPQTSEYAELDWAPFGTRLAVWHRSRINTISTSGAGKIEVTWDHVNGQSTSSTAIDDGPFEDPDWSPRGDDIVLTTTDGLHDHILIADACSTEGLIAFNPIPNQSRATFSGAYSEPSWSPDGTKIAFAHSFYVKDADRVGGQRRIEDIWAMNTDGTGVTNLTNTPATETSEPSESAPDWQPINPPAQLPDPPPCFREGGLQISQVTVAPDPPVPGDPFVLHVKVRNDGGDDEVTNVVPNLVLGPESVAKLLDGPTPASADLAPGESVTFDFRAEAIGDGKAVATVNASGTGPRGEISAKERVRRFKVGSQLPVELAVRPKNIGLGGIARATVKVTNETGRAIGSVATKLEAAPRTGVTISGPTGGRSTLPTGGSTAFQYRVTSTKKAELELTAVASARIPSKGTTVRGGPTRASLQVGTPTIVVTTAGDEALPAEALDARVCDVDAAIPDEQCTLRAAIELANAWEEVDKVAINFDIPGGGVPSIRPDITKKDGYDFSLPRVAKSVTIDGSTQPGGWVEVTRASADSANEVAKTTGIGIVLDGEDSVVRGLVVSGFDLGIVVAGDGTVVAGNRVGTDATGSAAAPNRYGIYVAADDVRVGGTAGTSAGACTGDCNLVGSSIKGQITAGPQPSSLYGDGFAWENDGPVFLGDGPGVWSVRGARVQGNWVGFDAGGHQLSYSYDGVEKWGIAVGTERDLSAAQRPRIGGVAGRPGVAPGNLVVDMPTAKAIRAFGAIVQGNTVGLDKTGTQLPVTSEGETVPGAVGIEATNSMVGGSVPGAGNAVAHQLEEGIYIGAPEGHESRVVGNLIGTDATGTRTFDSQHQGEFGTPRYGVFQAGLGEIVLHDNVISGNEVGVSGQPKITIGHGNLIGLARDGKNALPNEVGVGVHKLDDAPRSVTLGPETGSCPVTPCNVISGNREAGIQLRDVAEVSIRGAYIGTDISGTLPIPNLTGIEVRGYTGSERRGTTWQIGGPSRVLKTGKCVFPCNVIAGNTGAGVRLETVGTSVSEIAPNVAGNLIGVSADGKPLPNGGDAIEVSGSDAFPLVIGGDVPNGNVFFTGELDSVVRISSTGGSTPRVAFRTNRFQMTPWTDLPPRAISSSEPLPPLLQSAAVTDDRLRVSGTTNETSTTGELIELYAVKSCDPRGSVPLDGDPLGSARAKPLGGDFEADFPAQALQTRGYVAALRTDSNGRTSAFTSCLSVTR